MKRAKILISTIVAVIFLAVQAIAVGAAPVSQETTPITGTIVTDGITLETDSAGITTVVVKLANGEGTQTVRLSLDEAERLGLIKDDGTGNYVVDETKYGTDVEIDPATVIPDETDGTTEEPQHPVGSALSDFFSEFLGVDYETVMDYHDNGVGFGLIAQALWMTNTLEGDSGMFATILDAKLNNDFSGITLPDGSTPQNWGQFRKAVMSDQEKAKENLGAIMSGRAENAQNQEGQTGTGSNENVPGNGNGNALGNSNGNNNNGNALSNGNNNNSSSNGNASDNNNENGNNKDKNKDKNKEKDKDKGKNKDD